MKLMRRRDARKEARLIKKEAREEARIKKQAELEKERIRIEWDRLELEESKLDREDADEAARDGASEAGIIIRSPSKSILSSPFTLSRSFLLSKELITAFSEKRAPKIILTGSKNFNDWLMRTTDLLILSECYEFADGTATPPRAPRNPTVQYQTPRLHFKPVLVIRPMKTLYKLQRERRHLHRREVLLDPIIGGEVKRFAWFVGELGVCFCFLFLF